MGFFRKKGALDELKLKAFVSGKVIPITEVSDEVFSSKTLGNGLAIQPSGQTILAPCSGEITMAAKTGHAIGMVLNNGAEILLHIGLDTVSLNGEGFQVLKKQGEKVKQGTPLIKFDKKFIEEKGFSTDCILVITNSDDFPDMELYTGMDAVQDETVICGFKS